MADRLPRPVQKELYRRGLVEPPLTVQHLGAGSSAVVWKVSSPLGTPDNPSGACVVKWWPEAPADFFACEARGLQTLAATGALATPRVLGQDRRWLCLSYCPPTDHPQPSMLGRQLARMHAQSGPWFGFSHDNYCGPSRQLNPPTRDGCQFFAESRLLIQGRTAYDGGRLSNRELKCLERLCGRLQELIPAQAPVLVHGDLWAGNVLWTEEGPVLVDPACHYGWAEAELAMTELFGGFAPAFYQAYSDQGALAPDWRDRAPLYNLYHLLNHLNLFGGGYRAEVAATLKRYS